MSRHVETVHILPVFLCLRPLYLIESERKIAILLYVSRGL